MVGRPAPPFVFHNVHQRTFPSDNLRGKTLVLVFIRPGQVDLQLLLHEIEKLRRTSALAQVQFVVMAPEGDPFVKPFWIGLRSPMNLALDYTNAAARYGAGSFPLVAVQDAAGILRLRLDGFVGADLLPRIEAVRRLLHELERERAAQASPGG
jgi:hypothetical protein